MIEPYNAIALHLTEKKIAKKSIAVNYFNVAVANVVNFLSISFFSFTGHLFLGDSYILKINNLYPLGTVHSIISLK